MVIRNQLMAKEDGNAVNIQLSDEFVPGFSGTKAVLRPEPLSASSISVTIEPTDAQVPNYNQSPSTAALTLSVSQVVLRHSSCVRVSPNHFSPSSN